MGSSNWLVRGLLAVAVERRIPYQLQRIIDRFSVRVGRTEKTIRVGTVSMRVRRLTVDEMFVQRILIGDDYFLDQSRPTGAVVDVGANIGTFALRASRTAASVVAIEPEADNYRLLTENVQRNSARNVVTVNAAVSSRVGWSDLFTTRHGGFHSLGDYVSERPDFMGVQKVRTLTLESILGEHAIDTCFLKLDCEGAEHEILAATPTEILERVERLAMEYHVSHDQTERERQFEELTSRIRAAGLQIDVVQPGEGKFVGCGMLYASREKQATTGT